jgi:hypothetical protein
MKRLSVMAAKKNLQVCWITLTVCYLVIYLCLTIPALVIVHSKILPGITQEQVAEAISAKLPGSLNTFTPSNSCEIEKRHFTQKSLHTLVIESDSEMMDKIVDEEAFESFNLALILLSNSWHIFHSADSVWAFVHDIAFQTWFSELLHS